MNHHRWGSALTLLATLGLLAVLALGSARRAAADLFFCEGDPVVNVNGHDLHIFDGILASVAVGHVTGTATLLVEVPEGIPAYLVSDSPVGFTEQVTVVHGAVHGRVRVLLIIPADQDYAATLWSPSVQRWTYGETNHVMELDIPVPQR